MAQQSYVNLFLDQERSSADNIQINVGADWRRGSHDDLYSNRTFFIDVDKTKGDC
jgi:hypothetical protein